MALPPAPARRYAGVQSLGVLRLAECRPPRAPAPGWGAPAEPAPLSVVMRLATDTVHGFALPWRAACRCRLRIFAHPDRPTVVLVTALRDCLVGPPSLAVRSSAARLRADVCRWYRLDAEDLVWIVHFPSNWGHSRQFFTVDFDPDPTGSGAPCSPRWTVISRAHVEGLIGRSLAD